VLPVPNKEAVNFAINREKEHNDIINKQKDEKLTASSTDSNTSSSSDDLTCNTINIIYSLEKFNELVEEELTREQFEEFCSLFETDKKIINKINVNIIKWFNKNKSKIDENNDSIESYSNSDELEEKVEVEEVEEEGEEEVKEEVKAEVKEENKAEVKEVKEEVKEENKAEVKEVVEVIKKRRGRQKKV